MMQNKDITNKILEFINDLSKDTNLFPYLYNFNNTGDINKVYYSGPFWNEKEIAAIIRTVLTGKWISSGENVRKFEVAFGKKFNNKYNLMVNSGSSANLALLAALKKRFNWKDNDEIILSVVGFPTTLSPIIQNNLKPVFVDIEKDNLNFDLNLIEEKITSKTKAVILSPVLGNTPDMDMLKNICDKHNILLVLDNCDSLGSKWKGKFLNEYAIASSCSFYPAHHICTGEGGMVSSNDDEIIKIARSVAWWGRDCHCIGAANLLACGTCGNRFDRWLDDYNGVVDHKYVFTNVGYNLKPLDLQGAVGQIQIEKFNEIHTNRINNKNAIAKILLKYLNFIKIPTEIEHAETSWFGIPIICDNKQNKTNLVAFLEDNGIQTRNYFAGNILLHPAFKDLDDYKKYPIANMVLDEVFFIGCAPNYTTETLDYIEKTISKYNA